METMWAGAGLDRGTRPRLLARLEYPHPRADAGPSAHIHPTSSSLPSASTLNCEVRTLSSRGKSANAPSSALRSRLPESSPLRHCGRRGVVMRWRSFYCGRTGISLTPMLVATPAKHSIAREVIAVLAIAEGTKQAGTDSVAPTTARAYRRANPGRRGAPHRARSITHSEGWFLVAHAQPGRVHHTDRARGR